MSDIETTAKDFANDYWEAYNDGIIMGLQMVYEELKTIESELALKGLKKPEEFSMIKQFIFDRQRDSYKEHEYE